MKVLLMNNRPANPGHWSALLTKGILAANDRPAAGAAYQAGFDAYVSWGVKKGNIRQEMARGHRCLIAERAYLGDRFHWFSLGWNGLNGNADFVNDDVSGDRWERFWQADMKPWRNGGDYALIVGQVAGDAAMDGRCPYEWAESVIPEAKQRFGRVYFRPHPLCKRKRRVAGCEELPGDMQTALAGASAVITYSSNTGVLAVMEGIPTVTYSTCSMVYNVTSHNLRETVTPDRTQWGHRIAYAQWLPEELANGTAWRHVTRRMR